MSFIKRFAAPKLYPVSAEFIIAVKFFITGGVVMENQSPKFQKERSSGRKRVALPIAALSLEIFPFLFLGLFTGSGFIMLLTMSCPVVGLVLGILSLCMKKPQIGLAGKIIAIVAVSIPVLLIGAIMVFFVGASTGVIPLM